MAGEQHIIVGCTLRLFRNGPSVLVEMTGVLKLQNCEAIKNRLLPLLPEGIQDLSLHMAQISEVDSAGLGVLVGLHMSARKNKVEFHLLAPTNYQMKLLEATRLNSVLDIRSGMHAEEIWLRLARPEFSIPLPEPQVPQQPQPK